MCAADDFPKGDIPGIQPWEQRSGPGAGGGWSPLDLAPNEPEPAPHNRVCQTIETNDLADLVDRQTGLARYPLLDRQIVPDGDQQQTVSDNREAWQLFLQEKLYDTRRVTLKHFHLFEWFPLAPGRFHTTEAFHNRQEAAQFMVTTPQGYKYFDPYGKAGMIRGGIGAVRLRPRLVSGEPQYFMTASSNGVCHEGFPVLVPRRFYGPLKARMLQGGAVPVTLSGEMRYLSGDVPTFFNLVREIPVLYLHVDRLEILPAPRPDVQQFQVSAAVSFAGKFEGQEGMYATFATFDPARPDNLQGAIKWLEDFYVTGQYQGVIVTDFDEVQARFPGAVFGLPELMAGKMDAGRVGEFLKAHGFSEASGQKFFLVYKEINTMGGAYIEGSVNTGGGDFVAGDKNVNVNIGGNVIDSNLVIGDNNTLIRAAEIFAPVYRAIEGSGRPAQEQADLKTELKEIETAIGGRAPVDESWLAGKLRILKRMAPDIAEVALAALAGPAAAGSAILKKVAEQLKAGA